MSLRHVRQMLAVAVPVACSASRADVPIAVAVQLSFIAQVVALPSVGKRLSFIVLRFVHGVVASVGS